MPERETRKRATALRYESGQTAPTVLASGVGLIAERIVQTASEAGVPITHDPALAEALGALQIDGEIPPELYAAVAETLAWAYRLDTSVREGKPASL
jgi:flagellar biosynthesis protein